VTRLRRITGQTFLSLRVRNFRLYFLGQLVSISGTWLQSFALAYLVLYVLNGSGVDLGVTIALPFLPMLLLGPLGGVVVDRSNKRRILYATQSAAGLLALTMGLLVSTHHVTLPAIWTVGLLLGVVNLFDNPARQSFVQEMVGRDLLPNAVSLNTAMINLGRVVGPAIGGVLLLLAGVAACFYVNAVSFAALLLALALMRTEEITPIRTVERAKGQVRSGFRYAWGERQLREVLVAVVVTGLFAWNFTVTLPILTHSVLHGGSRALTYVYIAMGVGGLLGSLVVAHRARPTRRLLCVLALAFGVLMAGVAVAPSVLTACLLIIPMGAASLAFLSTANATLQLNSREEMRGRVMSLYAMGFLGTTPIGALVIGAVADAVSARVAIGVGAAANLAACAYLVVTARERTASVVGAPATTA
jgi:predicted MFS family arabinose efflux permease